MVIRMDVPEVIEEFYGVYLLYCLNAKFLGRTYIGYTVDPNRRINQHNKGSWAGGARRTSNRGPWKMVMIIHGFPNNIAALRFEWAWQNPERSRRLLQVPHRARRPKEKQLQYRLRILAEMLLVGPWTRLPLSVRWLAEEFAEEFPPNKLPPFHIPICHGPVKSKKIRRILSPKATKSPSPKKRVLCGKEAGKAVKGKHTKITMAEFDDEITTPSDKYEIIVKNTETIVDISVKDILEVFKCVLCKKIIENPDVKLTCLNKKCDLISHLKCLSELFLESGEYVPIEGDCPFCCQRLFWGDLIREMKGCQDHPGGNCNNSESLTDDVLVRSENGLEDSSREELNSSFNGDDSIVLCLSDSD